jgi:hypothetical protein
MIKKVLKWLLKILIGITFVGALLYGGFHLWEYATGGKYLSYLTENSQTIALDEPFSFDELGKDVAQNRFVLVGEIHGSKQPNNFDLALFKYLHQNHNINHYIAEVDFVQASLLNEFLSSGDNKLLNNALAKWAVVQGRNNKDYFDKYRGLHEYYKQLPENEKFEIIGVDRIQDAALLKKFLINLYPNNNAENIAAIESQSLVKTIEELSELYSNSPDTLFILSHLKFNIALLEEKEQRDEIMFQNFSRLYKEYQLEEAKFYGFMGLGHVFQYRVNGMHPFASKLRISELGFEGKMLTINIMLNDSYMVMPSNMLPSFMTDGGPYTKMAVSSDNMLLIYILGVKDFKRMTPEYHKSLIKMNTEDNPYANSSRLNKTIQILPVVEAMEMTDKGKPYFQYTVFIRNSDWAEPIE